jgi:hypothetical protein
VAAVPSTLGGRGPDRAQACKADGKACKKHSQCCSGNCVGGTGTGSTGQSAGTCQPAVTCLELGAACNPTTDTCCQTAGSTAVCEFEAACGFQPQGDVCCRQAGQACENACQCCGFLGCVGGFCGVG